MKIVFQLSWKKSTLWKANISELTKTVALIHSCFHHPSFSVTSHFVCGIWGCAFMFVSSVYTFFSASIPNAAVSKHAFNVDAENVLWFQIRVSVPICSICVAMLFFADKIAVYKQTHSFGILEKSWIMICSTRQNNMSLQKWVLPEVYIPLNLNIAY